MRAVRLISDTDGGGSMQKRRLRLRLKLDDEKCTQDVHFSSGTPRQAEAKIVAPVVRSAVASTAYSAAVRVVIPVAAA